MLASKEECLQYRVEMIVQSKQPEVVARFSGAPLSIDTHKDELKVYAVTDQLMKSKVNYERSFIVAYKMWKN